MAKKKKLTLPANYMDAIYRQNPDLNWQEEETGNVVIDIVHKGFYHKIAQTIFHKPRVSHISLDRYGSVVWNALDGKNTVYDIVLLLQDKFPSEQSKMLERVVTFIHTLDVNHFILLK